MSQYWLFSKTMRTGVGNTHRQLLMMFELNMNQSMELTTSLFYGITKINYL